jgi:hypothetical protein
MRKVYVFCAGVAAVAALMATACNSQQASSPKGSTKAAAKREDGHNHGDGPHGGTVVDWGGGKYHVEFCMDHGKKQATVYILGGNARKPAPIKADKLQLSIKEPLFQVELKAAPQEGDPQGSASRFIGTHDNFGKEQEFAGTISGTLDGKPYAGDFKEEPESPAKK